MANNFYGLGANMDNKVDYTGIGSLGGANPYEMDQYSFNVWADQNPIDAAKLGDLGYQASDANLGQATGQGFGDLGFKDQATLGLGAVQAGLGVAGYFDDKKTAKLQRQDLSTRIASNRDLLATRKERAGDISKTFGLGA